MSADHRVQFDFEIEFANGGALQGQEFRLDIEHDEITDERLGAYIIADLRLLMVSRVTILNKSIIEEPHKRARVSPAVENAGPRQIDLSHVIEAGMITYKGLPAPLVCDHLSRETSRSSYDAGTEFQIDRIEMVGNTGTYLDTPFHRYADGYDLAALTLETVSGCPGVVINVTGAIGRAIDWTMLAAVDVRGKAVLVHTGLADRPVFRGPCPPDRAGGDPPSRQRRPARRDRFLQHRRHCRRDATRAFGPARGRHSDCRAFDQSSVASRGGFPFLGGAAEVQEGWHLSGPRPRDR